MREIRADRGPQVTGFPSAKHKGFKTLLEAEHWLKDWTDHFYSVEKALSIKPPPRTDSYSRMHDTLLTLPDDVFDFELDGMPGAYPSHVDRPVYDVYEPLHTKSIIMMSEEAPGEVKNDAIKTLEIEEDLILFDPAPVLSKEQARVLDQVMEGESIFFTGSAGKQLILSYHRFCSNILLLGSGKSVLLRAIIAALKKQSKEVAVTASTGIASVNIDGTTLHSFAGVGLGKEPVWELARKLRKSRLALDRWLHTDILVIDESVYMPCCFSHLHKLMYP